MYFSNPKEFSGFRDKPSSVVLLDEANVRLQTDKSLRPFAFALSHANGESVVLAAESEKEMHEWVHAIRTSRLAVADPTAASMAEEETRRASAEADLDAARNRDAKAELAQIEQELEATQKEQAQLEVGASPRHASPLPFPPLLLSSLLSSPLLSSIFLLSLLSSPSPLS